MEVWQRALDCAGGRHVLAPGRLVSCDSRDSSVFADDAQVMQRITNLAHEMNVHIMIIAHAGKRKADDDPMKVIAGTNGLTASVDDVFVWFTMMESENILVRDETKRRILALLGGGAAMTPTQLAPSLGRNRANVPNVHRALNSLVAAKKPFAQLPRRELGQPRMPSFRPR